MDHRRNIPYRILLAFLILCAIALVFSIRGPTPGGGKPSPFIYAQGYFSEYPRLGNVRVVPYAGPVLRSPASPGAHTLRHGDGNGGQSTQNSSAY